MGTALSSLREVVDRLRSPSAARAPARPARHDVRTAVLAALAEQPATGYQIVRLLEGSGAGQPAPTAGTVYPMLQLLADEGLATATETDGRRTWTLTAAGRTAAEATEVRPADEQAPTSGAGLEGRAAIARAGARLAQVVALAAPGADRAQVADVVAVLDGARREVLAVLARR